MAADFEAFPVDAVSSVATPRRSRSSLTRRLVTRAGSGVDALGARRATVHVASPQQSATHRPPVLQASTKGAASESAMPRARSNEPFLDHGAGSFASRGGGGNDNDGSGRSDDSGGSSTVVGPEDSAFNFTLAGGGGGAAAAAMAAALRDVRQGGGWTGVGEGSESGDGDVAFAEVHDVAIHVYDLSKGLVRRFSPALVGREIAGLWHTGIVVYGFEYFFEGGVQRTPKGLTRFGTEYEVLAHGTTSVVLADFEEWVRTETRQRFQLHHYRATSNNCHHFVSAAAEFLTGRPAPSALLENTATLAGTDIGQLATPLMDRVAGGYQHLIARQQRTHRAARRSMQTLRRSALRLVDSNVVPPTLVFSYPTSNALAEQAIRGLCAETEASTVRFQRSERQVVDRVARMIGQTYLDPGDVEVVIAVLVAAIEARERWSVAPVLDAWRVLALHPSFLGVAPFQRRLNTSMLFLAHDFFSLPLEAKVSYLRVLCNYSSMPHGAVVLVDRRRFHRFVGVVGFSLISSSQALATAGASLACNLAVGATVLCKGSFDDVLEHTQDDHAACRLCDMLLFHANVASHSHATLLRVLFALYHLVLNSDVLAERALVSPIRMRWHDIFARCETKEPRQLLRLIQQLLVMENDALEEAGDVVGEGPPATRRQTAEVAPAAVSRT